MKKLYAIIATVALFGAATAQNITPCDELFISEYVEGSRNNKALEIYNPSNRSIDLKNYRVTRWQNGSATWANQYSDVLSGTIGPNETKVLVLDKRDVTKTGLDTPVVEALRKKADLFLSPVYEVSYSLYFNGDDAMSLDRYYSDFTTWVPVDIMGKIGERPPFGGWSDSFPYNNGLGKWYTANKTLVRKRKVLSGIDTIAPIRRGVATTVPQAANPTFFNPSAEWILYPIDFFDSLGSHDCGCLTLGTQELENAVSVYPNPVNDILMVTAHSKIAKVSMMDLKGMCISLPISMGVSGKNVKISTETLNSGMWILQIQLENGVTLNHKIQK
jgi:hypothetical protein